MTLLTFDGTFAGLLTTIFETYEYKFSAPEIAIRNTSSGSLFAETHEVVTNEEKARRVNEKLKGILSKANYQVLYKSFLSEKKGIENSIFRYVQYILSHGGDAQKNYTHPDVMELQQMSKKVHREKHRMEAFVRFSLTKDELYYSIVKPDFNVLPLITRHFKNRYADQRWLIYDAVRKYGIYYDLQAVSEIQMDFKTDLNNSSEVGAMYDEDEALYQTLWKQYFSSVNIAARKNTKLHIQHMPKRYWKYLVEKQG